MARQQIITYVDDIDHEELTADEVRVVEFGYRGTEYTVDLSELNAAIFDEEMEPFLVAARKLPPQLSAAGRPGRGTSSSQDKARNRRIRAWAVENDRPVSSRGKIAADVIQAYEAVHPQDR